MAKRFLALVWLRWQIIFSNKSILLQVLLPFFFAYLYKYIYDTRMVHLDNKEMLMLLMMCVSLSLALAVGNPISVILSEEKEKNTLNTLLLSGIKKCEYIISSMFFPLILTVVILGVLPVILQVDISKHLVNYFIIVFATAFSIILIYLSIGLLCKNQVSAQVSSFPTVMVISFLPLIAGIDENVARITDYSFMGLFTKFFSNWEEFSWSTSLPQALSLSVWILFLIVGNVLIIKNIAKIK